MTIVYFDSSAFVKLVVEEDGSEVAAENRGGGRQACGWLRWCSPLLEQKLQPRTPALLGAADSLLKMRCAARRARSSK
jgi:hypothetical protein